MAPPQEPKKSKAERFQDYLSRRVHGPSSTDPNRPFISNPRPFGSQNELSPLERRTQSALREERAQVKAKKENPIATFIGSFKTKRRANSDIVSSSRPAAANFRPSFDESPRVRFKDEVEEIIEVPRVYRRNTDNPSGNPSGNAIPASELAAATLRPRHHGDIRRPRGDNNIRRPRDESRPSRSRDESRPSRSRDERRPNEPRRERRPRDGSGSRSRNDSLTEPITPWPSAFPQAPPELRVSRAVHDPSARRPVPHREPLDHIVHLDRTPSTEAPREPRIARRPVPPARSEVPAPTAQRVPRYTTTLEPRAYVQSVAGSVVSLVPEHQTLRNSRVRERQVTHVEQLDRPQSMAASVTSRYSRPFDSRVMGDSGVPPVPTLPTLPPFPTLPDFPRDEDRARNHLRPCRLCQQHRIQLHGEDLCSTCLSLGFMPPSAANLLANAGSQGEGQTSPPSTGGSSHPSDIPSPLRLSQQGSIKPFAQLPATTYSAGPPPMLPPRASSISPLSHSPVSPLTPSPPRQQYAIPATASVPRMPETPDDDISLPPTPFMGTTATGETWLMLYRDWERRHIADPLGYNDEFQKRMKEYVAYFEQNPQQPVRPVARAQRPQPQAQPQAQQPQRHHQTAIRPPSPFMGQTAAGNSWLQEITAWRARHPDWTFEGEEGAALRERMEDAVDYFMEHPQEIFATRGAASEEASEVETQEEEEEKAPPFRVISPPPEPFRRLNADGHTWLQLYRAWQTRHPDVNFGPGSALQERLDNAVATFTMAREEVVVPVPARGGSSQQQQQPSPPRYRDISPPLEPFAGRTESGESWVETYRAWTARHPSAQLVGTRGLALNDRIKRETARLVVQQTEVGDEEEGVERASGYYGFYDEVIPGSEVGRGRR
ncbi:MAG: hypothetical protein Q9187_001056 [Circinaria calcarea]